MHVLFGSAERVQVFIEVHRDPIAQVGPPMPVLVSFEQSTEGMEKEVGHATISRVLLTARGLYKRGANSTGCSLLLRGLCGVA